MFQHEFLTTRAVVLKLLVYFWLCNFWFYYFEVTIDVVVVISLIAAAFIIVVIVLDIDIFDTISKIFLQLNLKQLSEIGVRHTGLSMVIGLLVNAKGLVKPIEYFIQHVG